MDNYAPASGRALPGPSGGKPEHPSPEALSGAAALASNVDRIIATTGDSISRTWDDTAAALTGFPEEAAHPVAMLSRLTGGKFLRSRLAVATYVGLGGSDDSVAEALAAAVQLLHVGLCVHDDLIDGDARRHGRPNIAGLAFDRALAEGSNPDRASREATAAAILAGDLAIAAGQRRLLAAPGAPEVRLALATEMLDALSVTIGGEWLDVRGEIAAPESAPTDAIATLKTARYTTVLPLRLGALAAGAGKALDVLTEFGDALGVAYQMKDDELGVFGDPDTTGKSVTADLRSGKRTGLLRLAYELATTGQRAQLDELVGRAALAPADANRLRLVIVDSGARAEHRRRMSARIDDAVTALEGAETIPRELSAYLVGAARTVVPRES